MAQRATTAVLMGDLIAHRSNDNPKTVHSAYNQAVEQINRRHAAQLVSPLTITLGDEFQALSTRLADAFSMVSEMRLLLLGANLQCRFVVGTTTLDSPINPERAWNMMGEGLADARHMLNDKAQTSAYRFSLPNQPVLADLLNTLGYLLTQFENDLTDRQRVYALDWFGTPPKSVAEIAERHGVGHRSVHKVLRSAGREYIERLRSSILSALTAVDGGYA